MKYFCKSCERVLNDDEIYQTSESQQLEYWGVPVREIVKNNHCCYCNSDNVDCLNTDKTVYTVSHKVGNAIIVYGPYYSERDTREQVEFLKTLNMGGRIKTWE